MGLGKMKKIISIVIGIISIVILIIGVGMYHSYWENRQFEKEHIRVLEEKVISLDLSKYPELPTPVRRYFEYTFQDNKEVRLRNIQWEEKGQFRLAVGEFTVAGRQFSQVDRPIYQWEGVFSKWGWLPLLESRDIFYFSNHNMRAKLLSWITVMDTQYDKEKREQLHGYLMLRYYGTAVKFPWALLPDQYKTWEPKDDHQAYLVLKGGKLKGRYLVTFNEQNQIISMETDETMLHGNNEWLREVGKKKDYRLVNGFYIPTRMEYEWYDEKEKLYNFYYFDVLNYRVEN